MGRRAVDESNPWASLCPAGEKKGRKQMCVSNLCSWKKKKQENWFSNPGNLRLTESMSISLDSPCQTVCLHLPFLSLTTKLGSCLTRAALGCTCPFITFLWKKKKKKPLWPRIWNSTQKRSQKRGSEMISSRMMVSKPVPNFHLIFFGLKVNFIHYLSECKE